VEQKLLVRQMVREILMIEFSTQTENRLDFHSCGSAHHLHDVLPLDRIVLQRFDFAIQRVVPSRVS
jgi:hypothetical protein